MASYFKCELNKPAISYKCGEPIRFEISAMESCRERACQYIRWELTSDDGKSQKGLGSCEIGKPLVIETSLDVPGFVHLSCRAFKENNSADTGYDVLDISAGAEVEKIEYHDTLPDDFYEYWESIEKMVEDCPIEVLLFNEVSADKGYKAYDIRIKTPEGRPASLLLTVPDKEGKFPMYLTFMPYSLIGACKVYKENMITACFNTHGIENDIPKIELIEKYKDIGEGYGFDDNQNSSNMTTYWRGVAIRNLIGTKYLKTYEKWDGKTFILEGSSQGGLQAATVAAHTEGVTYLELAVPWFCDLGGVNYGFMSGWRPSYNHGVRYFDTVSQAMHVKCPVKIKGHLGDYICPPSTIMALYNSVKTAKTLTFVQAATHGYNPPYRETFSLTCDPSESKEELKKGIYRHFKGNEYEVLDFGLDCETLKEMVIYRALYGEKKIWVRPKDNFCELLFKNGRVFKRFEFIK